jgi:cyclopropane-fatty-acyl-phospholipid synthase
MSDISPTASTDVTPLPGRPFAQALARRLLKGMEPTLETGTLQVGFPGGAQLTISGTTAGPAGNIRIHQHRALRRVAFGGALGLADAYVDGDWESDDLAATLEFFARNLDGIAGLARPSTALRALTRIIHARRPNTRRGSRRNIMAHYDLGNAFYETWLDPTMTYSAAMFTSQEETLETAQRRKFDRLADALHLQPDDRLLEIGCGWGGFAIHAARRYGARVTALTVSPAQARWARQRVAEAGVADRVEIRLEDYRDTTETFDKIASVEMFEAVGERYWPLFFNALRSRLRPGGRAAMQVITIDDKRFDHYRRNPDFIQLRVFPGGMLPSGSVFEAGVRQAGMACLSRHDFGDDYAETLRRWRDAFEESWCEVAKLGFDARFRRLWRYYLSYCEAGFRAGNISVEHISVARP